MSKKQIDDLQVRLRLRWFEHYEKITKKVSPTCRYFGISRGTFYHVESLGLKVRSVPLGREH